MNKLLVAILALLVLSAILSTFYKFFYTKNYAFTIEASCDTSLQNCFVRDCSEGDCPPNNYEEYRIITMSAKDYESCGSEDACVAACTAESIECLETLCGESEEDVCIEQQIAN